MRRRTAPQRRGTRRRGTLKTTSRPCATLLRPSPRGSASLWTRARTRSRARGAMCSTPGTSMSRRSERTSRRRRSSTMSIVPSGVPIGEWTTRRSPLSSPTARSRKPSTTCSKHNWHWTRRPSSRRPDHLPEWRGGQNSTPRAPQFQPPRDQASKGEGRRKMEASRSVPEREPSGWAVFAGITLLIVGSLDAFWGLAAILEDKNVIVGGNGVIIYDATTWGWVYLYLGSLVALTGVGLLARSEAARWAAIFFVSLNAIVQIVWFPSAPLWAFLIIILDVTIIYGLTAGWDEP